MLISFCGLAITPEKQKAYVYYHCTEHKGKHGALWVREEVLTAQFLQFFAQLHVPEHVRTQIINGLATVHEQKMDFHTKQYDQQTKKYAELTTMIDNLYLDKLRGKIDDAAYERFNKQLQQERSEVNDRLSKLQQADDQYFLTVKYILEITQKAGKLFESSEVDKKRQLIGMLLQNLRLSGENLVYDVQKPFDLILKANEHSVWCAR